MSNKTISKTVKLIVPLKEAAEMLSMTRQTVMSYVHKGELACVRLARNSVHFRISDLETFIEDHLERLDPLKVA